MSRTYSVACTKCKKHLWIAQGRGYEAITQLSVYSTEKNIEALEQFLIDHYQHPLVFDDNCEHLPDDFEEVEVDD